MWNAASSAVSAQLLLPIAPSALPTILNIIILLSSSPPASLPPSAHPFRAPSLMLKLVCVKLVDPPAFNAHPYHCALSAIPTATSFTIRA